VSFIVVEYAVMFPYTFLQSLIAVAEDLVSYLLSA